VVLVVLAEKQASDSGKARAGTPVPGSIKGLWPDEAVASGWSGPGQLQSRAAREEGEDFADGGFLGGGFGSGR
jgi:hypothetical protein